MENKDNLLMDDSLREDSSITPTENDTVAEDFFSQLDRQVMGEVLEQPNVEAQVEQTTPAMDPVVEQNAEQSSVDWEKRYSDSSREAKRLNTQLQDLEPYMPLLNAMKEAGFDFEVSLSVASRGS
jgi:hypothetical protein